MGEVWDYKQLIYFCKVRSQFAVKNKIGMKHNHNWNTMFELFSQIYNEIIKRITWVGTSSLLFSLLLHFACRRECVKWREWGRRATVIIDLLITDSRSYRTQERSSTTTSRWRDKVGQSFHAEGNSQRKWQPTSFCVSLKYNRRDTHILVWISKESISTNCIYVS